MKVKNNKNKRVKICDIRDLNKALNKEGYNIKKLKYILNEMIENRSQQPTTLKGQGLGMKVPSLSSESSIAQSSGECDG